MPESKYLRLRNFARQMRKKPTDAEKKLWFRINRNQILGFKFLRQKILGSYIVDFYSRKAELVIELDGGGHYTPESKVKDKERDDYLRAKG